ncbi:hypothetical protein OQA88_6431 [Cercophora sp. LCS_1]
MGGNNNGQLLVLPQAEDAGDSFSTSPTPAENTPLLRSETASSHTARDGVSLQKDEALGWKRTVAIVLSMWILIFLQAGNMSGISTIQSTIAAELNAYEHAMWFTSSYLITMSSVAPLVGRLAMVFSPGAMILFSSVFFSIGAVVTGQAHDFVTFILGRVLVGIGGGGVMTLSLILVIQLTSKKRRGLMIGLTNAGFTIGLSVGAVIFGTLLPVIGWASMPPSAAHPTSKSKTTLQKLASVDYLGATTLTLTIVLFLYSLSTPQIQTPLLLLSILLLLPFFLLIESVASTPILPLPILAHRGILLSCLSQLAFMAARWTILYYSPVFGLAVLGLSPGAAGAMLIPTNIGFGSGGLVIGHLHIRRAGSFWLPCVVSLFCFGLVLYSLSFVSTKAAPGPYLYVFTIFLHGICTGGALNYTLAHLLHLSEPGTHFIVTGLLSTFRGFAGSFGTAIGGGVFGRTLAGVLEEGFGRLDGNGGGGLSEARKQLIVRLVGSPAAVYQVGVLTDAERLIAIGGYETALKVLYRGAAAVCVLVLFLQAGTGWTGPVSEEEEEEIEEAIVEHDGLMEA